MPCERIGNTIICSSNGYKFKGFYFEWHSYFGPSALRKDGEISKRIPSGFWDMIDEFQLLSDKEKEKYRV